MSYYLVDTNSGLIVNCIAVDERTEETNWQPPADQELVFFEGPASIGWIWDGTKAIDSKPEPAALTASANVKVAKVL